MPFGKEHEMYDILADWLKKRKVNPCENTVVDKKEDWRFTFSFGGKQHRVDVMGLYTYDDNIRFVGIEAKLKPKKILSASRQALPLANFCHEVYVAVPKESYQNLSSREQGELRAQLLKMYTGLLLVQKTGKVRVTSEIPLEPIPFSLDLHKEAEIHFRLNYEANELLDVFRNRTGKRGLGWLKEDWKVGEDYDSWTHGERGRISFLMESIVIDVNVHVKELLTGVSNTYESLEEQTSGINELIQLLGDLVSNKQLVTIPKLVVDPKYQFATIDIETIDQDTLPSICSLIRTMGHPDVVLRAELPRPVILKSDSDSDEHDFIDVIRLVYDLLLKIALGLESFSEVEMD